MAKKSNVISLTEKVKVVGLGKFGLPQGKVFEVHPLKADTLVKKGAAKLEK